MFSIKRSFPYAVITISLAFFITYPTGLRAQAMDELGHDHKLFPCLEDGLKSSEFGCELLTKVKVRQFPAGQLFWYLSKFQSKLAAEAANKHGGVVVEAESKFWLLSFRPKGHAPKQGELVAGIGPLQLTSDKLPAAKAYEIVAYLAVMPAGTYSKTHTHAGPEAWFILSGEQCLETPAGIMTARAGESMIAPPATPMSLTNNGKSVRRALFIVIHDAAKPWSIPTDEWKPTGACYLGR